MRTTPAVVHSQTYSCYPYSIKNTGRHFIDGCIRNNAAPLSTMEDAITCMKLTDAFHLSVDERRVVDL